MLAYKKEKEKKKNLYKHIASINSGKLISSFIQEIGLCVLLSL